MTALRAYFRQKLKKHVRGERDAKSVVSATDQSSEAEEQMIGSDNDADIAKEMCDRCSTISWELHLEQGELRSICMLHETAEELLDSDCRICRIFGKSALLPLRCIPPIDVSIDRHGILRFKCNDEMLFDTTDFGPRLSYFLGRLATQSAEQTSSVPFADMELVNTWLANCKYEHEPCAPVQHVFMFGIKVLDCIDRKIVAAPESCAYVALSYVWGTDSHEDMSSANFADVELPRTIEDSMEVTRQLGYRYLWVDRYCIDQNNAEDKDQQIRQMGAIYSSAEVTIIAAAGASPSFGLPGISRGFRLFEKCEPVGAGYLQLSLDRVYEHIARSLWASRAWTFQEAFLSKRRLFFADQGVAYICNENAHCESGGLWYDDYRKWAQTGRLRNCLPHGESGLWGAQNLLQEYSRRNLTSDYDALNAIIGALSALDKNNLPVYHIWGVPFSPEFGHIRGVDVGLLWYHKPSEQKVPCRRLVDFPSWSPIGWKGVTSFESSCLSVPAELKVEMWRDGEYQDLFALVVANKDLQDLSSNDESKTLRVSAHTVPFKLQYMKGEPNHAWPFDAQHIKLKSTHTDAVKSKPEGWYVQIQLDQKSHVFMKPSWDSPDSHIGDEDSGICLVIHGFGLQFLVLYGRDGIYKRSGYFSSSLMNAEICNAFLRDRSGDRPLAGTRISDEIRLLRVTKRETIYLR